MPSSARNAIVMKMLNHLPRTNNAWSGFVGRDISASITLWSASVNHAATHGHSGCTTPSVRCGRSCQRLGEAVAEIGMQIRSSFRGEPDVVHLIRALDVLVGEVRLRDERAAEPPINESKQDKQRQKHQPAAHGPPALLRAMIRRVLRHSCVSVGSAQRAHFDFHTAVDRLFFNAATRHDQPRFAESDGLHATDVEPQRAHEPVNDGVRAALAEVVVEFIRAKGVRVTLDDEAARRIALNQQAEFHQAEPRVLGELIAAIFEEQVRRHQNGRGARVHLATTVDEDDGATA